MPRKARIDAPGALHHIIIRGIEKSAIFRDDLDRENFIKRLSELLLETATRCFAWSLMASHCHLLLRTGGVPISSIMRRLLTGYAISFNRRHRRYGHLFQNRYKSILCEEDKYLRVLVAYIHLNPVRAEILEDAESLKNYPFTGHSALMGKIARPWQDTKYVLALFGKTVSEARKNLQRHLSKWLAKGRSPELTGGGLIRSAGGWRAVKDAYRDGIRLSSDERMLGSSEFVEMTLQRAGEVKDRREKMRSGFGLPAVTACVCRYLDLDEKELNRKTNRRDVARARALISHVAISDLGFSGSEVARRLNVDRSTISRAMGRMENDADFIQAAETVKGMLRTELRNNETT